MSITCQIEDEYLRVDVEDSGLGIKAKDVPKLFQTFQQIDSGVSRKHEGTGLGLSICKKLVEKMGGKIGVTSDWGRGSVFSFFLPLHQSAV